MIAGIKNNLKRKSLAIFVDACIVVNAYTLASLVLFSQYAPLEFYDELLIFLPFAIAVQGLANIYFGLYNAVGKYVGLNQAIKISKATIITTAILIAIGSVIFSSAVHAVTMVPVGALIVFILMSAVRLYPRIFYERSLREIHPRKHLLVIGAGRAAEMLVRSIHSEPDAKLEVQAFVDDNIELQGLEIHGVPIYSPIERIPDIVQQKDIDEILISIPSASQEEFQRIWSICSRTGISTKALRPLQSYQFGKIGISDVKEIGIEDLLGRQPVQTDYTMISNFLKDKVVLVTGAGGSIGSELTLQIGHHGPARIILVDQDESALYQVHEQLNQQLYLNHEMYLADIKSEEKMEEIFRSTNPDIVFHAAAYKHVPLMEMYPEEAVQNNVYGTFNMARLAGEYQVESFVNISTDKAVEPLNVLGASKHLGELLVYEFGSIYPHSRYCSVRFGNVLGSRGSVIPIFKEQILKGGPITVTHPEMTRYFMLISEAVDLVLQASSFPEKNSIYVLEMGKPVRIVDLAEQMIALTKPAEEVEIVFTGLRPGEKLHEHLIAKDETAVISDHPKIYRVHAAGLASKDSLLERLHILTDAAAQQDHGQIRTVMQEWIPSYTPFDMNTTGSAWKNDSSASEQSRRAG